MKTPVIVGMAAAATLLLGLANLSLSGGWSEEGLLAGSRITARWAFAWFIVAWSASSVARLWPGGWRAVLLRRRRAVGLGFAAGHFVHAGFFIAAMAMGTERSLVTIVGGGLGYAFIAAMTVTSNDASVRAMGPKAWKLLHQVGGWYVLVIFLNSYLGRLLGEKPLVGLYGVGLIALAIALRIAAFAKGRARLQAA